MCRNQEAGTPIKAGVISTQGNFGVNLCGVRSLRCMKDIYKRKPIQQQQKTVQQKKKTIQH